MLVVFGFLSGCATVKHKDIPGQTRPRIGLVLGGGAARGFAHVGVIRLLAQENIPIDMIVGISVGSLIGVMYADKKDSFELEWLAFNLEKEAIFDFSLLSAKKGPVKGKKLEKFIEETISVNNIEELKIPFIVVAADLNTGERVLFESGSIAKAVRASCSIPGVFSPLKYQGRNLIDGGVLGNIAPEVAREKGADIVITVDIGRGIENPDASNVIEIALQGINILKRELDQFKAELTDILIQPDVGDVKMMDFEQKKRCITAGIEATKEILPLLKTKINKWKK